MVLEFIVEVKVVHVEELEDLYCKVYPVEPATTAQLSVTPVCVIFVLVSCVGAAHPEDDVVTKDAWEEYPEQLALTCQT